MTKTVWTEQAPLVLASASATRRVMLEETGLPIEIIPATIDERAVDQPLREQGVSSAVCALALAHAKAQAVSALHPGRIILGADQILDCDGIMLDKVPDRAAAERQLAFLAGKTHRLTSAAAIIRDGEIVFDAVTEARLTMRALDSAAIALYADHAGQVLTASVGCYAIEGLGAHLFERVEGDHFTVRGLPLLPLLAGFRMQGWIHL